MNFYQNDTTADLSELQNKKKNQIKTVQDTKKRFTISILRYSIVNQLFYLNVYTF